MCITFLTYTVRHKYRWSKHWPWQPLLVQTWSECVSWEKNAYILASTTQQSDKQTSNSIYSAENIKWSSTFTSVHLEPFSQPTGPRIDTPTVVKDIFFLFLTSSILAHSVVQNNKYASSNICQWSRSEEESKYGWGPIPRLDVSALNVYTRRGTVCRKAWAAKWWSARQRSSTTLTSTFTTTTYLPASILLSICIEASCTAVQPYHQQEGFPSGTESTCKAGVEREGRQCHTTEWWSDCDCVAGQSACCDPGHQLRPYNYGKSPA